MEKKDKTLVVQKNAMLKEIENHITNLETDLAPDEFLDIEMSLYIANKFGLLKHTDKLNILSDRLFSISDQQNLPREQNGEQNFILMNAVTRIKLLHNKQKYLKKLDSYIKICNEDICLYTVNKKYDFNIKENLNPQFPTLV